jgi:arylsulfatase A-like enzyme
MFVAPGVTKPGGVCRRPVDFMSIYPTLTDLCGLPTPKHVEGPSLRPLLADPQAAWDRPALTTYMFNNHAVRTDKWRYIRYADGSEELYDHDKDPMEWTNLARDKQYDAVKAELAKGLPKQNTPTPKGADAPAKPAKPKKP